jgi:melibiose permease
MLVKFAAAFSGFFIGVGLTLIGYVPNEVQTDTTVIGLRVLMIFVPACFLIISIWIYRCTFRLHGPLHAEVEAFMRRY